MACANTWIDAYAAAGATYQAYATAIATVDLSSTCTCGQRLFADAAATIEAWGHVWAEVCLHADVAVYPTDQCGGQRFLATQPLQCR